MAPERTKTGGERGPGGDRGRKGPGGREGPGGRGGGRGGKGEGRGRGREGGKAGGASFRVVTELGAVEKALGKADLEGQRLPLEEILKALRPLHLKSMEDLDLNTRGKLITTLMRLMRQPRPAGADAPASSSSQPGVQAAPADAQASAPDAEAAATPTEVPAPAPAEVPAQPPAEVPAQPPAEVPAQPPAEVPAQPPAEVPAQPPAEVPPEAQAAPAADAPAPDEAAAGVEAPAAAAEAPKAPPVDPKVVAWRELMYVLGGIWRACGDERRAALAWAESGRKGEAREAVKTLHRTGDWQEEATALERQSRTRDAARVHEKQKSWAEAARLYEGGGDTKAALRCAALGHLDEVAKRLEPTLAPADVRQIYERGQAWDRLMVYLVGRQDWESVARLYEKAKQYDQAGAAWERADKLTPARKAYERAQDAAAVDRVRALEVQRLLERGDRLGAATLLVGAGQKAEAVGLLSELPGPKAFRFLQKVKLDTEALAFAKAELEKAEAAGDHPQRARWLELVGDMAPAADAWVAAGRSDRALACHEQLGNWETAAGLAEGLGQYPKAAELFHRAGDRENAERVLALPPPAPAAPPPADPDAEAATAPDGAEGR